MLCKIYAKDELNRQALLNSQLNVIQLSDARRGF